MIFKIIYNFPILKLVLSGKLEKGAVLKAICAGFEETTEPAVCLSSGRYVLSFGTIIYKAYFVHLLVLDLIVYDLHTIIGRCGDK